MYLSHLYTPSTNKIYANAITAFETFIRDTMQASCILPCLVTQVALFVANLHHQGMAPKTISTYLSAVSYVHKIRGLNDPTQAFLVRKLTTGAYRLRLSYDLRLPITIPILNRLILSLQYTTTSRYDYVLFRAMYLFVFETFARIGEIQELILSFSSPTCLCLRTGKAAGRSNFLSVQA